MARWTGSSLGPTPRLVSPIYRLTFLIAYLILITAEFWDYGHELFKSTPQSFPAVFIPGDALSPDFIAPRVPFYDKPKETHDPSIMESLKSLNPPSLTPLQGHISAIHAASLFHLFNEDRQLVLAQRLASLLSPVAGSVIFGSHIVSPEEKGWIPVNRTRNSEAEPSLFGHSPETWRSLWDGNVFKKGSIRVETMVQLVLSPSGYIVPEGYMHLMWWSVTRL